MKTMWKSHLSFTSFRPVILYIKWAMWHSFQKSCELAYKVSNKDRWHLNKYSDCGTVSLKKLLKFRTNVCFDYLRSVFRIRIDFKRIRSKLFK
jgi:hypothetical protein